MIKKTKSYEMFIFREDNREKIDQSHVKRLVESIKSRNLLELRPIVVNDQMEVIDGQHRLMAAKQLGVEIYYQQEKNLDAQDIIKMNISKPWTIADYFNFYCHHQYDEYMKLKKFMQDNNISLKVALTMAVGQLRVGFIDFRNGKFQFKYETLNEEVQTCWNTINYIKKINGFSSYTSSNRFWKALLKLVRHRFFDEEKWLSNMQKMIDHFSPKAREEDYISMLQTVYNWRNNTRINLIEDEV